ncbi:hypothetical protein BH09BAC4_BH09BAC4_15630 [soil metagenome]
MKYLLLCCVKEVGNSTEIISTLTEEFNLMVYGLELTVGVG